MASKKRKSKKLSATKELYERRLKESVFFVDRSSGKHTLAKGLRDLGLTVERHDDHFAPTTSDPDWIAVCGMNDWVIVSSDRAIKRNALQQRALLNAGVAAFFFTSANITSSEQINVFGKALPRIARMLTTQPRPFIARINLDGTVELWLDHNGEDRVAKRRR